MGDTLCAVPVVFHLATAYRHHGPTHLVMRNRAVRRLISWPSLVTSIWTAMPFDHKIIVLDIHKVREKETHPTRHLAKQAGMDPSAPALLDRRSYPIPMAEPTQEVPQYDIVLAPHCRAPERTWPLSGWITLLFAIHNVYPKASIAVLGASDEPKPFEGIPGIAPVTYEYGRSLAEVVAIMRGARIAVVTIDSGPSRLAQLAGIENHVLICSDVVPRLWGGGNPAFTVYGPIKQLLSTSVLEAMRLAAVRKELVPT